jgi:predicted Zn-dependent protease
MIERQATPWTQDQLHALAEKVMRLSTAEAVEVVIHGFTNHLTRFANSQIHQNVSEQNLAVTVRVAFGQKVGQSTTNHIDDESLKATVQSAEALAHFQPDNPEFPGFAIRAAVPHLDAAVARTLGFTPADRARVVHHVCHDAIAEQLNAAGQFSTGLRQMAIANSNGLWAYHEHTLADFQTVVMSDDSSGWAAATHIDAGHIDGEALAEEAIDKALRSRNPQELEPGVYPVILEEYAVNDMIQYLAGGFSGEDVRQGRSFMSGRHGEQAAHKDIHVWDDGNDLTGVPWPFDWEGVPKQKVNFLEHGRIGDAVYDMRAARLEGRTSTGHYQAGGAFWGPGIAAWNLFMAPGVHTKDEMLESTERGILVTRFHYVNRLDAKRTTITGMTRDGTFWVENGKIVRPLKNMRFTQGIMDALDDVEMIGNTTKLEQTFHGGGVRCPALKIKNFRFSGKTTF